MMGHVTLVGAGPGDPGLLTLKGKKAIENADVVVFDRLVSRSILSPVICKLRVEGGSHQCL